MLHYPCCSPFALYQSPFPSAATSYHLVPVEGSWHGSAEFRVGVGGQWRWGVGGWIMASMLTRHTSNLHHPDTSGSCMSPPSMLHTHCPPPLFCLSPPGTPAFLSASGSHKSANPPALLTALPQSERGRKGERDIEWQREAAKPLLTQWGESLCQKDKERRRTIH